MVSESFSRTHAIVLGFDLRDDSEPRAALIVNSSKNMAGDSANVLLPFKTTEFSENEAALFRHGSYDTWTVVTFSVNGQSWPQRLDFVPAIDRTRDAYEQVASDSGFVFLESNGQDRFFRYRYPDASSFGTDYASIVSTAQRIDVIDVLLPPDAKEIAVRRGRLSVPDHLAGERVFPGESPDGGKDPFLELAYEVPATEWQLIVVKNGVKFLVALAPIIGLLFVDANQIRRPRLRRWLVGIATLFFTVLLCGIIWAGSFSTEGRTDIFVDLALFLTSAGVSGIIGLVKVQKSATGDFG